jgi:hypothetical protein
VGGLLFTPGDAVKMGTKGSVFTGCHEAIGALVSSVKDYTCGPWMNPLVCNVVRYVTTAQKMGPHM